MHQTEALSQSVICVSAFVSLMTKSPVLTRQFSKAVNWEEKSCLPVEFLLTWVTRKEPVKEQFVSCCFMACSLDFECARALAVAKSRALKHGVAPKATR